MDADKVVRRLAESITQKFDCVAYRPSNIGWIERELAPVKELVILAQIDARSHDECEDGWYSCPKHPDYLGTANRQECLCGADRARAALAKLEELCEK